MQDIKAVSLTEIQTIESLTKKNYSNHFCCSESIVEFLINHFLIAHEFNLFLCLRIQFFYLFMLSHSTCRSLNSTQRESTQQIVIRPSSTTRPRYAYVFIHFRQNHGRYLHCCKLLALALPLYSTWMRGLFFSLETTLKGQSFMSQGINLIIPTD